MDTVSILSQARALISAPERTSKDYFANGPNGERLDPQDPLAVCWDPVGAMLKVAGMGEDDVEELEEPILFLAETIALNCGRETAHTVDDAVSLITIWSEASGRKHPDILRAFDETVNDLIGEEEEDD